MTTAHVTTATPIPTVVVPHVVGSPSVHRFTVDQYHRMIESGILGENDRVELVDGWILEMSAIGPPHEVCVSLILAAIQHILPRDWFVRVQAPITLDSSEPQPDVAVVRGRPRDYLDRHPGAADIALVVEVADTSLGFDRLRKQPQYAAAGIAEYWIVNLIDRRLEVHRDPSVTEDYREREVVVADGNVEVLVAGKSFGQLAVAELLP